MSGYLTLSNYIKIFVMESTDISPTQKIILTYLIEYHPSGKPLSLEYLSGKIGIRKEIVKKQMINLLDKRLIRVLTHTDSHGKRFYIEPTFADATSMGATIVEEY